MKKLLLLLIPVFAFIGCMSAGKIKYTVRVDHFDGPEAVVFVHISLNPFESWKATPHKPPPIELARQLLNRELGKRGVFNYAESGASVFRPRENSYEIGFKLKGEREKFRALLGVNMPGDISSNGGSIPSEPHKPTKAR